MTASVTTVRLNERTTILVEGVRSDGREEEIARRVPSFDGFSEALGEIARSIREKLEDVRPTRAAVEFGVDMGLESGQLTAMIVKGTGAAHVTVTLEWDSQ